MSKGKRKLILRRLDEDHVQRMIDIFGERCAAGKAMYEFNIRRNAGEDVGFWLAEDAIVVGPALSSSIATLVP